MMVIDDKIIEKLSELARLEFKDKEKENIIGDLTRMMEFIEKLKELNTDNVEPLVFMSDRVNVLRNDEELHAVTREEALKNAPSHNNAFFSVPKVISK